MTGRTKGIKQQIHSCMPKQGGTTELAKPPSLGKRDGGFCVFSIGSKSSPTSFFIERIPRNIGQVHPGECGMAEEVSEQLVTEAGI